MITFPRKILHTIGVLDMQETKRGNFVPVFTPAGGSVGSRICPVCCIQQLRLPRQTHYWCGVFPNHSPQRSPLDNQLLLLMKRPGIHRGLRAHYDRWPLGGGDLRRMVLWLLVLHREPPLVYLLSQFHCIVVQPRGYRDPCVRCGSCSSYRPAVVHWKSKDV